MSLLDTIRLLAHDREQAHHHHREGEHPMDSLKKVINWVTTLLCGALLGRSYMTDRLDTVVNVMFWTLTIVLIAMNVITGSTSKKESGK